MRLLNFILLIGFIAFFGFQLVRLFQENQVLRTDVEDRMQEAQSLIDENNKLYESIEFFSHPENVAKELKSRFDYKRPGETLIKVQ